MYGKTSLITILSSTHGRLRREQRDINKRDLQKALKYGTRSRVWKGRWKVEYDGIVFITDSSMTMEVTSFPSPLAEAPVTLEERVEHANAKKILTLKPERCISHTVLVIDKSGSMNTHDINLHRDRRTAAYSNVAMELVAEQIFKGTANNRDVVSLVEFNSSAKIVFQREPVTWDLYNKILGRRDPSDYQTRENAKTRDIMYNDSNYLPALKEAERLLGLEYHADCALALFFLSDGAPTDARQMLLTPSAATKKMCDVAQSVALKYGSSLTLTTVGFGSSSSDFSVLKQMVESVDSGSGTKASFHYCTNTANAIGEAVTSSVTSMTETRLSLMENSSRQRFTKRELVSEKSGGMTREWDFLRILDHKIYDPSNSMWLPHSGLPLGCRRDSNIEEFARRTLNLPPLIAISTQHCGEGAERVAFRCRLADKMSEGSLILGEMVAKETLSVEKLGDTSNFHRGFIETQTLASSLAGEFNSRLQGLPEFSTTQTPQLKFLECSVLILADPKWPKSIRGILVEKMMDTAHYNWTKWNNNAGAVDGQFAHRPLDLKKEMAELTGMLPTLSIGDIIEEGSEEEEEESSEEEESTVTEASLSPSDYLQAFTHFTYRFTNKKVMVCDLQGIYRHDDSPPVIELTDPAVHYSSAKRNMVFGRTDKGAKGMQLFFETHKCSRICKLMQLSAKNKNWRKNWHEGKWLKNAKSNNPAYRK